MTAIENARKFRSECETPTMADDKCAIKSMLWYEKAYAEEHARVEARDKLLKLLDDIVDEILAAVGGN